MSTRDAASPPELSFNLEAMTRDGLRELQAERLAASVRYVYDCAPFWTSKLDAAGVDPGAIRSLDDLATLPTCERAELQDDQDANPPAGSYAATEPLRWSRMFTTSGTSGRRLRRVLTARDWELFVGRSGEDYGLGPDDTVMLLGPTDGLFGPSANLEIAVRAGATVIPAGQWDTREKLAELVVWRPTVVIGSASYLVRLTDVAAEEGIDLSASGVGTVLASGEPGASIPATRALLRERFGGPRIVDRYGMTELPTLTRCSCPAHEGALHFNEDFLIVECLRPGTNEVAAPGEPGELVFTNLVNDTQPLLRYRSKDIGRLAAGERCDCGLPLVRLERSVEGRADDMVWYHGVNLFPTAVENAVRKLEGLGSGYRMVLRGSRDWPELTIELELASPAGEDEVSAMRGRVQAALQESIQVRPRVELLDPGALSGIEVKGKARRVVDLREDGHPTGEASA